MKAALSTHELNKGVTITHRQYLVLALPLIISGISTPILGAVDTAVIGRISDPAAIGGVAVGAVIFNTMYWLLGFLRVSTSGFTAQAQGANSEKEILLSLYRPMILAILFGFLFILFQQPILQIALSLIGGSEAVSSFAATYFSIRIWGAPFILLSYVLIGWLIGMGKVKLSLMMQITMNLLNIVLDVYFVLGLGMGVVGVAYATLISEVGVVFVGMVIILRKNIMKLLQIKLPMLLEPESLLKMLKVNRDLFFRTVCLLTMTVLFTAKGASMGEVTLAANAILLQIHYIIAYLFGGFANASSILVGRAVGGKKQELYHQAYRLSAQWGSVAAILSVVTILLLGSQLGSLFTTIEEVKWMTTEFMIWMVVYSIVGFWGLQLEGVFSGATEAKSIRNSIMWALLVFLIALWWFVPIYQNHGLWLAFVLFSLSRSVFLSLYIPKLTRTAFPKVINDKKAEII